MHGLTVMHRLSEGRAVMTSEGTASSAHEAVARRWPRTDEAPPKRGLIHGVELRGIEPLTSALPVRRSPS